MLVPASPHGPWEGASKLRGSAFVKVFHVWESWVSFKAVKDCLLNQIECDLAVLFPLL